MATIVPESNLSAQLKELRQRSNPVLIRVVHPEATPTVDCIMNWAIITIPMFWIITGGLWWLTLREKNRHNETLWLMFTCFISTSSIISCSCGLFFYIRSRCTYRYEFRQYEPDHDGSCNTLDGIPYDRENLEFTKIYES